MDMSEENSKMIFTVAVWKDDSNYNAKLLMKLFECPPDLCAWYNRQGRTVLRAGGL